MTLTWKDLATTLLAASVFGLYYAMSKGIELPVITSYRWAVAALGILGIAMCAFSGGTTPATGPFMVIVSILGVAALVLVVYGLITGAKIAFVLLAVTILALWVISTFRHLIAG